MKKDALLLALLLISPAVLAESGSLVKESVKSLISSTVSAGKEAISGVNDGINDGRKTGSSTDGAVVITDQADLQQYVTTSIISVEKLGDMEYKITLALRNSSDKIVRLTNLAEQKSLVLLDKEGFASQLKSPLVPAESDITIPEKAAIKARYIFDKVEGEPAILRLYGMDIQVTPAK